MEDRKLSVGSQFDPTYEFDAPTFQDFTAGTPCRDAPTDQWFDTRKESFMPGALSEEENAEFEDAAAVMQRESSVESLLTAAEEEVAEVERAEAEEKSQEDKAQNEIVNVDEAKDVELEQRPAQEKQKTTTTAGQKVAKASVPRYLQPTRAARARCKNAAEEGIISLPRATKRVTRSSTSSSRKTRNSRESVASSSSVASQAPRRMGKGVNKNIPVKKTIEKRKLTVPKTPQFLTKTRQRVHDLELQREREEAERHEEMLKAKAAGVQPELSVTDAGLTCPRTPKFQTTNRLRPTAIKRSEDMVLEQLEKEVEEITKRRKMNVRSMKRALIGGSGRAMPVRSPKPLTEPKEFKFATADRTHNMVTRSQSKETVSDAGTTATFAEMMQQFTRTPKRFHSKPSNVSTDSVGANTEKWVPRLTQPKEFHLSTNERASSKSGLSFVNGEDGTAPLSGTRAAKELEDLKECQFRFQARKLDKRIFESHGELGVPRVDKKPMTQFEEFQLATDARGITRSSSSSSMGEEKYTFKARPLSAKVLQGEGLTRSVEKKELTSFDTFKLATEERGALHAATLSARLEQEKSSSVAEPFRARPLPVAKPFVPKKSEEKHPTLPEGFHLRSEERHVQYTEKRRAELEREEEEKRQKAQFKARPLPVSEPMIPQPSSRPLTEPEPFHLKSEVLAKEAERRFREQAEAELERELQSFSSFRARDIPASHRSPYSAKKSTMPLTEIRDFELNSSVRAEKRKTFDNLLSEKEKAAEEMKRREEKEREEREREEIRELRRKMGFKATPIYEGKSVEVKKSERPLTVAQSPKLRTNLRALRSIL